MIHHKNVDLLTMQDHMLEETAIADNNIDYHILLKRIKESSLQRLHTSLDESSFCALMATKSSLKNEEDEEDIMVCHESPPPHICLKPGSRSYNFTSVSSTSVSSDSSTSVSSDTSTSISSDSSASIQVLDSSFDFSEDSNMAEVESCEGVDNSSSSSPSAASETMVDHEYDYYYEEASIASTETDYNNENTMKTKVKNVSKKDQKLTMKIVLNRPISPLHSSNLNTETRALHLHRLDKNTDAEEIRVPFPRNLHGHYIHTDSMRVFSAGGHPPHPSSSDIHLAKIEIPCAYKSNNMEMKNPNFCSNTFKLPNSAATYMKKIHGGFKFLRSSFHHTPFGSFTACLRKSHLHRHSLLPHYNRSRDSNLAQNNHNNIANTGQQRNHGISSKINAMSTSIPNASLSSSALSSSPIGTAMAYPYPSENISSEVIVENSFHEVELSSESPLIRPKCQSFRLNSCTSSQKESRSHGYGTRAPICTQSQPKLTDQKSASLNYDSDPSSSISALIDVLKPSFYCKPRIHGSKPEEKGSDTFIAKNLDGDEAAEENEDGVGVGEEALLQKLLALKDEISKLWKKKRHLAQDLYMEMKSRISTNNQKNNNPRRYSNHQNCLKISNLKLADQHYNNLLGCSKMEGSIKVHHRHQYHHNQKLIQSLYVLDCFEKELEIRRSKEWCARIEKIKTEERRLRNRVIEMAEEMVKMQREFSTWRSREASLQLQAEDYEAALQAWMQKCRKSEEEVEQLKLSMEAVNIELRYKEEQVHAVKQENTAMAMEKEEILMEFGWLRRASEEQPALSTFDVGSNIPCFSAYDQLREESLCLKELGFMPATTVNSSNDSCDPNAKSDLQIEADATISRATNIKDGESVLNQEDAEHSLDMEKMLCLTHRRVLQLEHELGLRDDEVKLLQSNIEESEWELKELRSELAWANLQRDEFKKQSEEKSQECTRLARKVAELKELAQKLDDELMLKEGEISILREAFSDSDF